MVGMVNGARVIDVDAHVEEGEQTWEFLDEEFQARRPRIVTFEGVPYLNGIDAAWLVDGRLTHRPFGKGANATLTPPVSTLARRKPYSQGSQDLTDVQARLRDMDRDGVDVQVIFPSVFNRPLSEDPRLETALHRAYNTWMAKVAHQNPDRLKWVAVMPLQEPELAVAEVNRARELGASGALVYPLMGGRRLNDCAFDPFYAMLNRVGLPLCIHVGWYFQPLTDLYDNMYMAVSSSIAIPMFLAFIDIVGGDVLARFPDLRVGIFEAGASWIHYWTERLDHYYDVHKGRGGWVPCRRPSTWLNERRVYFTFETHERLLPEVITLVGESQLMLSTDIPHAEGRERAIDELWERPDISTEAKRQICSTNAQRFFGFP